MSKERIEEDQNEIEASERRADRLKEISKELESGGDSEMARILAEIEARNKKN